MKKRILCFLLAALMLASVFVLGSCGDQPTEQPKDSGEAASTTAKAGDPADEKLEFTGEKYQGAGEEEIFRIYMRHDTFYDSLYIYVEEDEGDVMSSNTFKRNAQLEADCKIKLDARTDKSPENSVAADIQAGNLDYDIILSRTANMTSKAQEGLFRKWNDLDIDYTNVWWDKNCVDGYSIEGKTYFMANDVSVSRINNAQFLYFNKRLLSDYKLTDKDPYKLVESDDWTLDNFLELVKGVSEVKEGELGTYGWQFGSGAANGSNMHILSGCGVTYTTLNADGSRTIAIQDQMDKISSIWDKLYAVTSTKLYTMSGGDAFKIKQINADKNKNARAVFAAGHFLFLTGGMIISQELTDMQDDYGIAPNPKYDKNQNRYYHRIDKYSIIFAIPNSADVNIDRCAKVMDYWAFLSHDTVMPAYYEITIKARRFKDPTAVKMVDIVKDTILYEVADVFSTGISDALNNGFDGNNIASSWGAESEAVSRKFENIVTKIKELE